MITTQRTPRFRRNTILKFGQFYGDTDTEERFWGNFDLPTFEPAADDTFYEVKMGDRIDLLALQLLGDDRLKWVLMSANNIRLPEVELIPGMQLRIPSKRALTEALL